jgi:DNA topoisomerase-2
MDYVQQRLAGETATNLTALVPYYTGFKGQIIPLSETKFLLKGVYEILSDKQVRITELPIGTWTDDYKKYIEELIDAKPAETPISAAAATDGKKKPRKTKVMTQQVKDYIDMSTDTTVDLTITFAPGVIAALKTEPAGDNEGCTALEKLLKLYTTRSTTNMHVFDEKEKLVKCHKVEELIERYMTVRMDYYIKRKAYQVIALEKESSILSNKARFITELLEDTLDLRKKKTAEVSAILKARAYAVVDDDEDYKYLVRLPMDSVTEENIKKIMQERDRKNAELLSLKNTSETQLWLNELAVLRIEYLSYVAASISTTTTSEPKKMKIVKKK